MWEGIKYASYLVENYISFEIIIKLNTNCIYNVPFRIYFKKNVLLRDHTNLLTLLTRAAEYLK